MVYKSGTFQTGGGGGSSIAALSSKTRGQMVWAPIGFRGRSINGSAGSGTITVTGTAGANTQTIGWTPATIPVFATRLVFANFDLTSSGEADRPSTEVWVPFTASLNYQMANTVPPPYLWNGASSISLTAPQSPLPHGMIISDPLYYPMDANNSFGIRAAGQIAATTTYSGADYINTVLGSVSDTRIVSGPSTPGGSGITNFTEADNRVGTGWTDQTTTKNAISASGQFYSFSPAIILGLMHPPTASVVFFGDSIMQGQMGYVADNLYNYGYIEQGLRNTIPWVNLSRGTMQAANFDTFAEAQGVLSLVMGSQMYVTDMVMGLGRNDIAGGASAATVQASVKNASLPYQEQGIPVHVQTIPPKTASQDAWATTTNQFYISRTPTTTAQINVSDTTFTVSSATGITNGMLVASQYGIGIAPGTTITISGTTVTLSSPCTATIASGRTMCFGSATPDTYAATAISYNAGLRASYNSSAYNNNGYVYQSVIDIASVIGVVSSTDFKWAAGSYTSDGIHPNQTGGTAINTAGIPGTARFGQPY